MTKVAIFGGGIGGLSAAHELIDRGFEVDVYEASDSVGGKARNQFLGNTGTGGRTDLPGEHGFRFFPAFYQHLSETMGRIPAGDRTVLDNLIGSDEFAVASSDRPYAIAKRGIETGFKSLFGALDSLRLWFDRDAFALSAGDLASFLASLARFLTSCEGRRKQSYDNISWYKFADAASRSDNYQKLTASLPRTMVAMDGENSSAYTIGKIGCQLFVFDRMRHKEIDRVLNAPTEIAWLAPWRAYLEAKGVRFHFHVALDGFDVADGRVAAARVRRSTGDSLDRIEADFHIAAVPLEVMRDHLLGDKAFADAVPSVARLREIEDPVDWMVGAQYFLKRDVQICRGHVIYPDSEWALASISQPQFWIPDDDTPFEARFGNGEVRGILSVDISNWNEPSKRLGKPARECTSEQILDEVFAQIKDGLNHSGHVSLSEEDVIARHLDRNITFEGGVVRNATPLLVHPPGSLARRPAASTELPNLMLASDYVATHTNLATMEGANEAARRAVGHIMKATRHDGEPPMVEELKEPGVLTPFKKLDALMWRLKLRWSQRHIFDLDDSDRDEALRHARDTGEVSIKELLDSVSGVGEMKGRSGDVVAPEDLIDLERSLRRVI